MRKRWTILQPRLTKCKVMHVCATNIWPMPVIRLLSSLCSCMSTGSMTWLIVLFRCAWWSRLHAWKAPCHRERKVPPGATNNGCTSKKPKNKCVRLMGGGGEPALTRSSTQKNNIITTPATRQTGTSMANLIRYSTKQKLLSRYPQLLTLHPAGKHMF